MLSILFPTAFRLCAMTLLLLIMIMMVMSMMMMPARAVVASGVEVLRAGHLELMSVNKLMMRFILRLVVQRRCAATDWRRLMRV